ncbi:RPAC1 [Enterospora canceri]|uniref:RPAC1 n=1 Tax=Enterospora canceri TaxID=1081671 RepID=A0A1Y1S621_9MICR|nr:RPAC1 [Enterospora canceri]
MKYFVQMAEQIYKEDGIEFRDCGERKTGIEEFLGSMEYTKVSETGTELEFDLVNCKAPLANALRRIMLAEIRTVAFHDVTVSVNDSIFPDEYVAHRIGLVCIKSEEKEIVAKLDVSNRTKENMDVMSDDIVCDGLVIKSGILLCRLAPGQSIKMEMGIGGGRGREHAKWSPVSMCSYRLMPRLVLRREFREEEAKKLQGCCSKGVIKIVKKKAVVVEPRKETMSREVVRVFGDDVELSRVEDHFCFRVEGIMENGIEILKQGISEMRNKSRRILHEIE